MLSSIFLFFSFSASEIMFILFVALILFGGEKFPEIARGLGKGIREFKDMSDGVKREIHQQINSYEANPNRDSQTTTNTVTDTPPVPAPPFEPVSDMAPEHGAANPAAVDTHHEPAPVSHEAAETTPQEAEVKPKDADAKEKPVFTPPANTIPYDQSL